MMENKFHNLRREEKIEVFNAVAEKLGIRPVAVEKDWWVCRSLEIIFQMEASNHLVFKGGTSLSKAWKLIDRFSEDVDLAINKEFFAGYDGDISRHQINRLRKEAGAYTMGAFYSQLKEEFNRRGFTGLQFKVENSDNGDQDPTVLEIYYPSVIGEDSEYILPRVQIEIGCRSLREPFSMQKFGSFIDEIYADSDFASPLIQVPTVNPERTFLEKVFLLHEEFQRPNEKIRVNRLSRHLYDLVMLSRTNFADKALADSNLYETIVRHRYKFTRVGGVDYNLHHPTTVNPIPPSNMIDAWRADYAVMREQMIYKTDSPTFDELMKEIKLLQDRINTVPWSLSLSFSMER